MTEEEGVIKFTLNHQKENNLKNEDIRDLNYYRHILWKKDLIGVYPSNHEKFPNIGFGNISKKTEDGKFIITGTQTGEKKKLEPEDCALVEEVNLKENHVKSKGMTEPSSESLTHAAVYKADKDINCVIHAHSQKIWEKYKELGLYYTKENAEYGTPELAEEVQRLFNETKVKKRRIFVLLGHEEGVITFGKNCEEALEPLLIALDRVDE